MYQEKIVSILAELLNLPESTISNYDENKSLQNLLLDSIIAVQLIVKLEGYFDIEILDEDLLMEKVDSISNIHLLIRKYQSSSNSSDSNSLRVIEL